MPFPRIKCYQLWHPQPDQPTDVGWLRALMSTVSEGLVAQKARRAKQPQKKEESAEQK